jgi:glycosyltransferase involved in cell wall biosynthesis
MTTVLTDLLFYTGTRGGMESYVREVYSRIQEYSPETRFVGLASSELARAGATWFPGELIDSGVSSTSSARWALAEIYLPGRVASRLKADVIHSPANIGPIFSRTPVVLTIQDVLSFRHPEFVPGLTGAGLRWLIREASRRARRILTISAASAADITTFLQVSAQKITIIPLAGSGVSTSTHLQASGERPMVLSGGNRLPHKNFESLVRAMALIPEDHRPLLVITGGPVNDPLLPLVRELNLEEWVDLRSWVAAEELTELYAAATAYVFPTRFEGFGLPVVEAMARGCPVMCSDIPVLHEVGGDAALFVDTLNLADFAQQISSLLADPRQLAQLREKGRERAATFSWDRTAAQTAQVFAAI